MTGARRQQQCLRRARLSPRIPALVTILLAALAAANRMPARAATTGLVVTDSLSGLALSGFDPVAYFVDRTPKLGDGAHEVIYRGAVWRFRNEGNRAAFVRDPEVYAPRFGGYDPLAVGRGVALPGHPLIWLIAGDRLYLFSRPDHRASFAADMARAVETAERSWGGVERTLAP